MNEQAPAFTVVARLASDMLGLLISRATSPIENIVQKSLLANQAMLAEVFQREFSRIELGDHQQVATFVSSFVQNIIEQQTRMVRDDLDDITGVRFP
jgi:hypothetical protein